MTHEVLQINVTAGLFFHPLNGCDLVLLLKDGEEMLAEIPYTFDQLLLQVDDADWPQEEKDDFKSDLAGKIKKFLAKFETNS